MKDMDVSVLFVQKALAPHRNAEFDDFSGRISFMLSCKHHFWGYNPLNPTLSIKNVHLYFYLSSTVQNKKEGFHVYKS